MSAVVEQGFNFYNFFLGIWSHTNELTESICVKSVPVVVVGAAAEEEAEELEGDEMM
jgi:hypothetical protein